MSTEIATTESAPSKKEPGGLVQQSASNLPSWFAPEKETPILTSIKINTEEGYVLAMRAINAKDIALVDMVGQEIEVKSWLVMPYDGVDEDTGEEVKSVRIALIAPDDKVMITYSFGIRRSLQLLLGKYGLSEFSPPLRFKVESAPARKGRMLFLTPVSQQPVAKGKK